MVLTNGQLGRAQVALGSKPSELAPNLGQLGRGTLNNYAALVEAAVEKMRAGKKLTHVRGDHCVGTPSPAGTVPVKRLSATPAPAGMPLV